MGSPLPSIIPKLKRLRARRNLAPLERSAAHVINLRTAPDAPIRKGAQNVAQNPGTREQDAIYEVGMCHLVAGKEFSPAKFGFVCSKAEAEALVKRKWTLEHANNAHTWSLGRESCKPALAFAAAS